MRFFAVMGVSFGLFSFPQSDWKGEVFVDDEQNYQLVDPILALQKGWKRPKRGYIFGRRIDFATATEEALIDLPGVGPSLAKKLMMLRATNPHPSWADLDAVSGVGPVTLKRLKSQLILGE